MGFSEYDKDVIGKFIDNTIRLSNADMKAIQQEDVKSKINLVNEKEFVLGMEVGRIYQFVADYIKGMYQRDLRQDEIAELGHLVFGRLGEMRNRLLETSL